MNHINILKRSFNITFNYRALWIFGMLLALTTGGGGGNGGGGNGGSSNGGQPGFNGQNPFTGFPHITPAIYNALIGVTIGLVCIILILSVAAAFARYVSETALIRMVDEHEKSGEKLTVRQGFKLGWSRAAWKMFLMDLLVGLSFMVAFILLLAVAAMPLLVWLTKSSPLQILGSVIAGGLMLLVIFAAVIVGLAISLVMLFAKRAVALEEDLGVRASIRRGYEMVKGRLSDVFLMGVIMFGVGLLWALVSIPIILALVAAAALFGGLPALLVGMVVGLFTSGATPWIVAAIVGIPLFLIAFIIPGTLIGGWLKVFFSTAWTLTYRETLALGQVKANGELPAPETAQP
jgi:hypothetical protein